MLNGVGVICFAGSYLLAFILELFRFRWKTRPLLTASLALLLAGLTAHTAYLFHHFILQNDRIVVSAGGWFFVLAWGLVLLDLYLFLFYPKTPFGLFILPLVFFTIPAGIALSDAHFPASTAGRALGAFHGITLLMTTVLVLFGFLTGLMFLFQCAKIRSKTGFLHGISLPSLEWLQKANRRSAKFSLVFLGCGIVSGLYLRHLVAQPTEARPPAAVPMTDLMMIGAIFLFCLLFIVLLAVSKSDRNRSGGRIALLTLLGFLVWMAILSFGIIDSKAHWVFSPEEILSPALETPDKNGTLDRVPKASLPSEVQPTPEKVGEETRP